MDCTRTTRCRRQWSRSRRRRPRPLHPLMKPDRTTEPCEFGRSEGICFHVSELLSPPPVAFPRTPGCTVARRWPLGRAPRCRARRLHGVERLARAWCAAPKRQVVDHTHASDREAEIHQGALVRYDACAEGGLVTVPVLCGQRNCGNVRGTG